MWNKYNKQKDSPTTDLDLVIRKSQGFSVHGFVAGVDAKKDSPITDLDAESCCLVQ